MPKHFAAKGKYLEVLRSGKNVQSLNDDVDDVLAKTPEVIVADQGDILKDKLEVLSVDERYLMDMGFSVSLDKYIVWNLTHLIHACSTSD